MKKNLFLKSVLIGAGLSAGALATMVAAVTVGAVKTWTSGETLTAADLNSTVSSLKTAIEAIPDWVKSGTGAVYTGGNVGIGTASPSRLLEVASDSSVSGTQKLRVTATAAGAESLSLGAGADASTLMFSDTGSFWIGGAPDVNASVNATVVDLAITTNGNVGIGTTSPTGRLDVRGLGLVVGEATTPTGEGGEIRLIGKDGTSTRWMIDDDAADQFRVLDGTYTKFKAQAGATGNVLLNEGGGNVGIGLTGPSYQLQLSTDSAAKPGTSTWTVASDERLKKDIRPYSDGLNVIEQIHPVFYKYNGKAGLPADGKEYIGVIAQDAVKAAPYTVGRFTAKLDPSDKKETELLDFNSHALLFALINAVKEQQSEIESLQNEIQSLKHQIGKGTRVALNPR